jgi:hypothetical protein
MKTKLITIEGVLFVVPEQYEPPFSKLDAYRSCCGPGSGRAERRVPEKNLGLRMSVTCHIHDFGIDIAEPTWADFHQNNSMFIRNQEALIRAKSNRLMVAPRLAVAGVYYWAVDVPGSEYFKKLKGVEIT